MKYTLPNIALPSLFGIGLSSLFLLSTPANLGCNTFDPKLGDSPFRCGTNTPRCPDGYSCVSYSATEEVCELDGVDPSLRADAAPPGAPDARDFDCNNDSEIEPNESISDPTITGIPEIQDELSLVGLAICPSTDQDYFRFVIETAATDATIEVEYQSDRGLLSLDMLDGTGTTVGVGMMVPNSPNLLRVAIPNLPMGTYYAHVRSSSVGVQNNYSISIITNP